MYGLSPARIAFLRAIKEEGPADGLERVLTTAGLKAGGQEGDYYLIYYGFHQPAEQSFELPAGTPGISLTPPR